MGIYNKLAIIQQNLIAPKGNYNDFGRYNYRSCEDILKALKPLCDDNGCVCYMTNDLQQIGTLNYVKATVTLVDLETGETVISTAHAREEETKKGMDGSQITGASSSYARKYALAGLFCIDNEKDSDATNEAVKEDNGAGKPSKGTYTKKTVNTTTDTKKAQHEAQTLADDKAKILKYINGQNLTADQIKQIAQGFGKTDSVADWDREACNAYIAFKAKKGITI